MIIQQEKWRALKGKAYGLNMPTLVGYVKVNLLEDFDCTEVNTVLSSKFTSSNPITLNTSQDTPAQLLITSLLNWFTHLQQNAGLPIFELGKVIEIEPTNDNKSLRFKLALPYYRAQASLSTLTWLVRLVNSDSLTPKSITTFVQNLTSRIQPYAPTGSNTLRFLKAAHELAMPWQLLIGNTFVMGHGQHARWLDSSFTDQTSTLGARLARNKHHTTTILKKAGLPVAKHFIARNAQAAQQLATKLGFPVVVKPADKDRGLGVTAGLMNAVEVHDAFNHARKFSRTVLIEKHIEGQDYRLTVLNGKLIWAVLRIPGGVIGNGQNSITELLQTLNENPLRRNDIRAPLKTIKLDVEAQALLDQAGLSSSDIPAKGQFIRLRTTANLSNGGTPVAAIDDVHPDNQRLAEMAARALKLDLAGVDLIIPDISQSWLTSQATICEVNAQPQLGATTNPQIYAEILSNLVQGTGRISSILIVGETLADKLAAELQQVHPIATHSAATASKRGVYMDGQQISVANNFLSASNAALSNTEVEAVIILATLDDLVRHGLPLEQYDAVIMLEHETNSAQLTQACQLLFSHPIGHLFIAQNAAQSEQLARQLGVTKIGYIPDQERADNSLKQLANDIGKTLVSSVQS